MDALIELFGEAMTRYGLPVALCLAIMAAQGFFLWKLWDRNQKLLDMILGEGEGEASTPEERKKRRASLHDLDEAVEQTRAVLRSQIDSLLQSLAAVVVGDDREIERMTADLERLRNELAAERAANTSLHEKRYDDIRALHAEQLQTMRTATQSIEKLSAMLQGAMRRPER